MLPLRCWKNPSWQMVGSTEISGLPALCLCSTHPLWIALQTFTARLSMRCFLGSASNKPTCSRRAGGQRAGLGSYLHSARRTAPCVTSAQYRARIASARCTMLCCALRAAVRCMMLPHAECCRALCVLCAGHRRDSERGQVAARDQPGHQGAAEHQADTLCALPGGRTAAQLRACLPAGGPVTPRSATRRLPAQPPSCC